MALQLGIIGSPTGPYVLDLIRACHQMDVSACQVAFPELQTQLGLSNTIARDRTTDALLGTLATFAEQKATLLRPSTNSAATQYTLTRTPAINLNSLNAVIVRTMPLGSLEQIIFRMDCLHALQARGVLIVNSPRCLETSIDKWLTLQRLSESNLLVPPTIACQTRDSALEAFDALGRDVLVKPLFGGEGRGIVRLQDEDLAWRTFSTLTQLGHVLYLQQFIPNFGYDLRVLKIGDKLLSIRRTARQGSYRTNVSLGGSAEPTPLTEHQRELAKQAAAAVDGDVVGVDILPARDGNDYLLEVNAVPGWRGVTSALDCDVAQQIVEHVVERMATHSR